MNRENIRTFIKRNGLFYLTGLLLLFGMKLFYSRADADMLKWILAPTARWVSILSKIPFSYEPGAGYINYSFRFLIAPSCSGVSFMMITVATLVFSFVHRMDALRQKFLWMLGSTLASYLFTVSVNGLRIILAIYIPFYFDMMNIHILSQDTLHTLIGTATYFISLLVIYHIGDVLSLRAAASSKRTALKYFSPLFWYIFMVLGIPFLNRAWQNNGEKFLNYTLLVGTTCFSIFFVYFLMAVLRRRLMR